MIKTLVLFRIHCVLRKFEPQSNASQAVCSMLQNVKTISNTLFVMCKFCQMSSYLKTCYKKKKSCNLSNTVFAGYLVNEADAFYPLTVCLEKEIVASKWRPVINEACRYTDKHLQAFGLFFLAITEQTSTAATTLYVCIPQHPSLLASIHCTAHMLSRLKTINA